MQGLSIFPQAVLSQVIVRFQSSIRRCPLAGMKSVDMVTFPPMAITSLARVLRVRTI